MLKSVQVREGLGVQNLNLGLPLQPYDSVAEIVPNQVLGRRTPKHILISPLDRQQWRHLALAASMSQGRNQITIFRPGTFEVIAISQ